MTAKLSGAQGKASRKPCSLSRGAILRLPFAARGPLIRQEREDSGRVAASNPLPTGPPVNNRAPGGETGGAKSGRDERIVAPQIPPQSSDVNAKRGIRGGRESLLVAEYRVLCALQAPLERAFWAVTQRRAQIADRLANLGLAEFAEPAEGSRLPSSHRRDATE
jgi:hypothetical protein